jgi:hypothetical protein
MFKVWMITVMIIDYSIVELWWVYLQHWEFFGIERFIGWNFWCCMYAISQSVGLREQNTENPYIGELYKPWFPINFCLRLIYCKDIWRKWIGPPFNATLKCVDSNMGKIRCSGFWCSVSTMNLDPGAVTRTATSCVSQVSWSSPNAAGYIPNNSRTINKDQIKRRIMTHPIC